MLHFPYLPVCLSALCALVCCTPERSIVDDDDTTSGESGEKMESQQFNRNRQVSLEEHFLGNYDRSAHTVKGKDGVPQTVIDKSSSFQGKQYNMGGSPFALTEADEEKKAVNRRIFDASDKRFKKKAWGGSRSNNQFSKDLQPDFMKEGKGVAREEWSGSGKKINRKSADEGNLAYDPGGENIDTSKRDGIIEEGIERGRRTSEKIKIVPYRAQQKRTVEDVRELLGRKPGE